jgi:hypothetical protein
MASTPIFLLNQLVIFKPDSLLHAYIKSEAHPNCPVVHQKVFTFKQLIIVVSYLFRRHSNNIGGQLVVCPADLFPLFNAVHIDLNSSYFASVLIKEVKIIGELN